jgi:response regulator RpfG family c-di-GMP phosphodiesterase
MTAGSSIKVLCVDDEAQVLEGLELHLRRTYQVTRATSGAEGLKAVTEDGPFAVVVSDMRMPGMDGAAFLSKVRDVAPNTVRLLLTGYADLDAAIAAINEGGVFRFLTKPCPPDKLRAAFQAAVQQYLLITAERELLDQTVCGSIKTMVDILSMTCPFVFGRATRVARHAKSLAYQLKPTERWFLDAAAMLFELGSVAVPEETLKRHYYGEETTPDEQGMIARIATVTESFLANIPRLEPVRETISLYSAAARRGGIARAENVGQAIAANILRIAADFDALESRGYSSQLALDTLKHRELAYDKELLQAFGAQKHSSTSTQELRDVPLRALAEGMILAEDLKTTAGILLAARGLRVTAGFIERAKNFGRGYVKEPIKVIAKSVD